jgi:hypothetical protein
MSNTRDSNGRAPKETVPPDLKHALSLLRLDSLSDLEERFLSVNAFLKPWSVFRDSVFLRFPDAMPRATTVATIQNVEDPGSGVSRLDLLWFYTQFDDGGLRYDPRADQWTTDYNPDISTYGVIEKSEWRVGDYEKHLYAWLLQEFKVGKGYSPWRFEYLELKSICTAWVEVFVPIVNAVRASYDPKGRRYYGRLALYIEARCHSGLAFPGSNIRTPEGDVLSPTPYRVVSVPKTTMNSNGTKLPEIREQNHGVLTKKQYDETEKELRHVYPQYGGLVERPRFKQKMEDWLEEQRARAARRKAHEKHGEVQSFQPQVVEGRGQAKPLPTTPPSTRRKKQEQHQRSPSGRYKSESPIKRYADSIKRTFSLKMRSSSPKEDHKSPLHGVTRQLHFPDRRSSSMEQAERDWVAGPSARPEMPIRPSEQIIYTSIRNSNPCAESPPKQCDAQGASANTDDSVFSPMGQLSAIPHPLVPEQEGHQYGVLKDHPALRQKKSDHDVRLPSYEGTAYQAEISLTNLHMNRMKATRTPDSSRANPPTRLPTPIVPIPYGGPRIASADTPGSPAISVAQSFQPVMSPPKSIVPPSKPIAASLKAGASVPMPVAWPGTSPPQRRAWPSPDSDVEDFAPPIPSRSPGRHETIHVAKSRSEQLRRNKGAPELSHIVSKDNIRAALREESSFEELAPREPFAAPVRMMTPGGSLPTHNSNLFPRREQRKGTPVGAWVGGNKGRLAAGGAYEMEVLNDGKDQKETSK